MVPTRQNTISRLPWLGSRKSKSSTDSLQVRASSVLSSSPTTDYDDDPLAPQPGIPCITDQFREYIHNHIPARLLDTSKLKFVERHAVYDVFSTEIAQITDEDIRRRMSDAGVDPEAGIYVTQHKVALQETFRDVVRYAIFSHRWTDSEPKYQDVSTLSSGLSKQRNIKPVGLAKLVRLCEIARTLGYKLVWSDTCCIDKTNSTELSEAIQAMFRWYAHAHMCIVHLAASSCLEHFDHEPWFKRGWTLQELLAPRRIKFYDEAWRPFTTHSNDKDDASFMSALSAVTGIPTGAIVANNSHGIQNHGIWEIMSWAATRQTTRIEDTAYCLYGLFNVSLPITYGEGEKAFPRLVEAIVTQRPTWDVFAWAGQASVRHSALPSSPACYPKWEEAMTRGEVGMTTFTLTSHGLRLTSVPLIPLAYVSDARSREDTFDVTLRPQPHVATELGVYGDVTVFCGNSRVELIRNAVDLHACILNYKPSRRDPRGRLQVGRTYVCFLLHMEDQNMEGSTWLKFLTDNVLHIACKGVPVDRTSTERTCEMEDGLFDLPLRSTYIRRPHGQSTFRA